jgi:hypothetical protein
MYRICPICRKEFTAIQSNEKLCSVECIKKMLIINRKLWNKKHRKEINKHMKDYRITHKSIIKIRAKKYYSSPIGIYTILKAGAKQRNIKFFIKKEEFVNWYNNQIQFCHYCQRTLIELKQDNLGHDNRLTIDRKDNTKGYNLDNIILACYRCNLTKSNYFTEQEMLIIGKMIKNKENRG